MWLFCKYRYIVLLVQVPASVMMTAPPVKDLHPQGATSTLHLTGPEEGQQAQEEQCSSDSAKKQCAASGQLWQKLLSALLSHP